MNINFRVTNQKLVRTSFEQIVENSINYLFCNFEFSEDWNECSKNAYFSQNGTIWYVSEVNEENICEIPIEVIKHTGFRMYLVARDVNNNMKITTNIINLNVELSGNGEGEKPSITDINSETLNIERQGNIVKIEIKDDELENELKYDDYLKSNYDFNGKKILYVGDSITKGFTSGSTITQNSYPKLFSDYVNATFVNNAVGGALYTSGYNQIDTLLTQLTNTANKDTFDYVVLAGGTNDYGSNVTESDFRSAVTTTIEYALNNFTNAHIIVITPISFLRNNTNTISLQTYRNIITELAITEDVNTSNKVSVVQGYKFDMPQEQTSTYKTLLLDDGVHPTESGYKVYTRGLIKALCNR